MSDTNLYRALAINLFNREDQHAMFNEKTEAYMEEHGEENELKAISECFN